VHFTFDGWTFRQKVSFLGINAHFLNEDWAFGTIFLSLLPLLYRYTGNAMADEMAAVLQFFNIEDRRVGAVVLRPARGFATPA
jgi:hypothetical protein